MLFYRGRGGSVSLRRSLIMITDLWRSPRFLRVTGRHVDSVSFARFWLGCDEGAGVLLCWSRGVFKGQV